MPRYWRDDDGDEYDNTSWPVVLLFLLGVALVLFVYGWTS